MIEIQLEALNLIVWWVGAVVTLFASVSISLVLLLILTIALKESGDKIMRITRFKTAQYWVQRMEREGLTACAKGYRQMVKERKPKTVDDYLSIEHDW